jgi:hypothetical protein
MRRERSLVVVGYMPHFPFESGSLFDGAFAVHLLDVSSRQSLGTNGGRPTRTY